MKFFNSLFLLFALLFLVACSKDDDDQRDPLQLDLNTSFVLDLQDQGFLNEDVDENVFLRKVEDLILLISTNKVVGFDSDGNLMWEIENNYDFGEFTKGLINGNNLTLFSDLQFFNTKLTFDKNFGSIVNEVNFHDLLPTSMSDFTKTIIGSKIYIFGIENLQAPQHRLFLFEYEIGTLMADEIMSFEIPGKNYGGISRLVYDEENSTFYASFNANNENNSAVVGLVKMEISNNSHEIFELFEVEGMAFGNDRISLSDRTVIASNGGPDVKLLAFDLDSESLVFSRTSDDDFDQFPISHFTTQTNDLLLFRLFIDESFKDLYRLAQTSSFNIETLSETSWNDLYYMIGQDLNFHAQSATIPLYSLVGDFSDQSIAQIHFVSSANGQQMGYFDAEDIESSSGFISNPLVCNESNRLFVVDNAFNLHAFDYPF